MSVALRWRTERRTVCSNSILFIVLHPVFNQNVCFSITAMNYLNYVFNKIFQVLSNAFPETEVIFSPIFVLPASAIL